MVRQEEERLEKEQGTTPDIKTPLVKIGWVV